MLLFIDEPKHVRIVRQGDAGGSREPIGRIKKSEPHIPDAIRAQLRPAEIAEVEQAFSLMAEAEAGRVRGSVAGLPAQFREIFAYYKDSASPAERRWIRSSLQEALRLVRRHDRETAPVA